MTVSLDKTVSLYTVTTTVSVYCNYDCVLKYYSYDSLCIL